MCVRIVSFFFLFSLSDHSRRKRWWVQAVNPRSCCVLDKAASFPLECGQSLVDRLPCVWLDGGMERRDDKPIRLGQDES